MLKRSFDFAAALVGLILLSPLLLPTLVAIWLQDFRSPFYIAPRVGRGGNPFPMVKLRSMVVNADKTGLASTSATDRRITKVGRFVRAYKLDEAGQLWNVLLGQMSLVGPRPQVPSEVDRYTDEERKLLLAKPGVTDLASIVFSDEGDILKGCDDPDLRYNQVIRPWKSRMGLLYVEKRSFGVDLKLIWLTLVALVKKERALAGVVSLLEKWNADPLLIDVARRDRELPPYPPPGALDVVSSS
jgi:lipopolysaccharide/colanic/teichoic acid biosynthesis glycosyltransferase